MGALYLAYLYYKIAQPFLTHDPYGPTAAQFILGTVILGGGTVFLGAMSWKMYKTPVPVEEEPEEAEDAALPEEFGEEKLGEEEPAEEESDRETEE